MPSTSVLAALTMPYENFMIKLEKSIQVYRIAIATIVLIVCAFGYRATGTVGTTLRAG